VVGFEKMQRGLLGAVTDPAQASYKQLMGMMIMPGIYALAANKYMHEYGARPEHFAQVSVKSHRNATMNPYAQYQKELTLEEVLNSRMIADPITLYMCSPTTDGASAAVVCAKEKAHKFGGKPITIAGYASGTPPYSPSGGGDLAEGMVESIASQAFEMAGLGAEDIGVTQVHDAFVPGEIFTSEALGYCPRGEGAAFIWEGKADINGEKPINTDGGLVSRGHPLGATGLAQIAEIMWQLRGDAGPRQVAGNPKVGLCHNVGLGGCNITILKK
jgi:acetyl-CoA acetyltransferase